MLKVFLVHLHLSEFFTIILNHSKHSQSKLKLLAKCWFEEKMYFDIHQLTYQVKTIDTVGFLNFFTEYENFLALFFLFVCHNLLRIPQIFLTF
jgi:hypothetical protein